ncbi:CerR family C-terminal domain-containing protein [Pseudodesulfovibrio sediminis]|uniref:TetR family transcriptional regulator n=1 Tax=Pseudodesulfovibrio sediminis TaxID=2810563 RepID=A0ABN6EWF7_9BACT|nr:CerR family C-terminal domain-containing protein [Pseudodesulfovibrio sediminis]BCS89790.1 TetR family transcriptional regulator [Pseudodesulfovibrio sediminis]
MSQVSKKIQGEETRATLLETGARLFAQYGYSGVSMRTLATEAEVNLATVSYHFGGKAGLYEAIMQEIIEVRDEIFPSYEEVQERLDKAGSDTAKKALVVNWFVGQLVNTLLSDINYLWRAVIISREMAYPSELYPKLEREFFDPTLSALRILVKTVLPPDTPKENVLISSHCIIGIIIKFLECQSIITKRLGWTSYADHLETITPILQTRIRGLLGLHMEIA